MPSPTISNQIKLTFFKLGKINKDQISKSIFKLYSDEDDECEYVVNFDLLDLGHHKY
jgi:hypothetical protein